MRLFFWVLLYLVYNDIVIHVLGIYVSDKKNFKILIIKLFFWFIWPIHGMEFIFLSDIDEGHI